MTRKLITSILISALLLGGCGKRRQEAETALQKDESNYALTVLIDMSGSFEHMMADNGKAYEFLLQIIDRYFRDRMGSSDKIIIAEISGTNRALLWQGTPTQLRQDFTSASAFRDLLRSKATGSSNIHEAITQTLKYVISDKNVATGKAKTALFLLSDMEDTHPDAEETKKKAVEAMKEYGKVGGTVGFYYVDQNRVAEWRQLISDSGIKHWECEAEIVGRPTLPSFE